MVSQSSADLLLLDIPSAQTHTSHPSSPSIRQLSSRQRFRRDTFARKDKTLWAIRSEARHISLNRAPRIAAGMSAIFPDRVSSQHLITYLATDSRSSFLDRFHSRGHSVPLRPPSLFVDNKTPSKARIGRPTVLSSTNKLSTGIRMGRVFSQIGEGGYPSRCVWEAHQRPGHTYILTSPRLRHPADQLGFQPRRSQDVSSTLLFQPACSMTKFVLSHSQPFHRRSPARHPSPSPRHRHRSHETSTTPLSPVSKATFLAAGGASLETYLTKMPILATVNLQQPDLLFTTRRPKLTSMPSSSTETRRVCAGSGPPVPPSTNHRSEQALQRSPSLGNRDGYTAQRRRDASHP